MGFHLGKMFNNPEFSDIKFICEGGVIYGHKAVSLIIFLKLILISKQVIIINIINNKI